MSHKKEEEFQNGKEKLVRLFQELTQSLESHENAYANDIAQRIRENQSDLKELEADSAAFALRLQRLQAELSLAAASARSHYKLNEREHAIRNEIDELAVPYYANSTPRIISM